MESIVEIAAPRRVKYSVLGRFWTSCHKITSTKRMNDKRYAGRKLWRRGDKLTRWSNWWLRSSDTDDDNVENAFKKLELKASPRRAVPSDCNCSSKTVRDKASVRSKSRPERPKGTDAADREGIRAAARSKITVWVTDPYCLNRDVRSEGFSAP